MKKLFAFLPLLLALSSEAQQTIWWALTNWDSSPTTNATRVTPVALTPTINGVYASTGLPRLFPLPTNGVATWTNLFQPGNFKLELIGVDYQIPIYFQVGTNAGTFSAFSPGTRISGGNFFVTAAGAGVITNIDEIITTNIFTTNLFGPFITNEYFYTTNVTANYITNLDFYSTNIITTNLYATYSTNLYSYVTNLISTNIWTTNLYTYNAYITNLYTGKIYVTNLYATNLYVSNTFVTNLTANYITNNLSYITNLNVSYITNELTYITNLFNTFATNQYFYSSNAYITNLYSSNIYVTNLIATNYVELGTNYPGSIGQFLETDGKTNLFWGNAPAAPPQVWTNDAGYITTLPESVQEAQFSVQTNLGATMQYGLQLPGGIGPYFQFTGPYPSNGTNVSGVQLQFGAFGKVNNSTWIFSSSDNGNASGSGVLEMDAFSPQSAGVEILSQPTGGGLFVKDALGGNDRIILDADTGIVTANGFIDNSGTPGSLVAYQGGNRLGPTNVSGYLGSYVTTNDTRTLALAGPIYDTNVGAGKLLRTDANNKLAPVSVGSGIGFDGTTISATGSGGTVTSVNASGPAGFTWSGGPITGSGTLTASTPGLVLTNGESQASTFSNNVAIDVTHALFPTNATVSSPAYIGPNHELTNAAAGQIPIADLASSSVTVNGTANHITTTSASIALGGSATLDVGSSVDLIDSAQTISASKALTASNYFGKAFTTSTNQNQIVPDFTLPEQLISTNAAFAFLAPVGVDTTKTTAQWTLVNVTNTTAAAILVTAPANCHTVGTMYVTNWTAFWFQCYASKITNCYATPVF